MTCRAARHQRTSGTVDRVTGQQFLGSAATRLRDAGCEVSSVQLPGGPALAGHRSRFRLAWMATRLHLFTVMTTVPHVDASTLQRFSEDSLDYAAATKGALRGFQTGVATIAVLVGETVGPDGARFAQEELVRRFSAFTWPAAVDLATGVTYSHQGRVVLGGIYAGWMREQTALALGT